MSSSAAEVNDLLAQDAPVPLSPNKVYGNLFSHISASSPRKRQNILQLLNMLAEDKLHFPTVEDDSAGLDVNPEPFEPVNSDTNPSGNESNHSLQEDVAEPQPARIRPVPTVKSQVLGAARKGITQSKALKDAIPDADKRVLINKPDVTISEVECSKKRKSGHRLTFFVTVDFDSQAKRQKPSADENFSPSQVI